jgi:putative Ca2+/H+ antiporter (TMEM165/GDT1 family)
VTVALAARLEQFYPVVTATTLGIMLNIIRAVIIGDRIVGKLSGKATRFTAAIVFAPLGVLTPTGFSK